MMDVAEKAVDTAIKLGADYADARAEKTFETTIRAMNDKFEQITSGVNKGIGVRALFHGAWGFASSSSLDLRDLEETSERAVKAAKATSVNVKEKAKIALVKTFEDTVLTPIKENPLDVDVGRKMELLLHAHRIAKEISPKVANTDILYEDGVGENVIITSEGTKIFAKSSFVMLRVLVFAKEADKIRMCRDRVGSAGGFEAFKVLDVDKCSKTATQRAVNLLDAKPAPSGRFTIIADPVLAGTFAHEATGHACEGDSIIIGESVLKDKLGQQISSKNVSIYDDSIVPKSWSSHKYDDEGVKTKKRLLIDHGILKDYILNREAAAKLNLEPNGGARAQSYAFRPIARMSNTYIAPGDYDFDEMFEDIKYGIYLRGTRGGQVKPEIGSFQFNAEDAFLIKNGEITTPLLDVSISGLTLEILKNIDAVGKDFSLHIGLCGREDQVVRAADGGPHIRIRNAVVGGRS